MAVTVAYQGSVNLEQSPYTVLDLGVSITSEADGVSWLKDIDGSSPVGQPIVASVQYNAIQFQAPSPFKDTLGLTESTVGFSSDLGFVFGFDKLVLPVANITSGTTGVPIGAYARIGEPNRGAIALNLNANGAGGLSLSTNRIEYATGIYAESRTSDGTYSFHCYFSKSGGVYFFFTTNNGVDGKLGYLGDNSMLFKLLGTLQPLKRYYLTDVFQFISGAIKDAAGQPAASRVVAAYDRQTMGLVGKTISNSNGDYTLPITSGNGSKVFVVCLDDDAPPDFEAQIVDRIVVL